MSDDKESGKPGGWSPNINQLLLILLAGTLFVSQNPYHESRPGIPEGSVTSSSEVKAKPWQDPFEAVEKYIEKHNGSLSLDKGELLQKSIEDKITANDLTNINVVAVMLPGDGSFEDSETRRRVRYAVISGFNAALRYMPEDPSHIHFFISEKPEAHKVVYEWLVYKPTEHNKSAPSSDHEKHYERPPVLVLWLNGDNFRVKPHNKLKSLIASLDSQNKIINGLVATIKPLNGKISLFGEASHKEGHDFVNEINDLKKNKTPDEWKRLIDSLDPQNINLKNVLVNLNPRISSVSVLGPFDSDGVQDLVNEMYDDNRNKVADGIYNYFSPSATVEERNFFSHNRGLENTKVLLYPHFKKYGLTFLRTTITDASLADAIKDELLLRGIAASKENRILLIGEWDTLYDWHLGNTFATALLRGRENSCKDTRTGTLQNWDEQYDIKDQCIFRASYLRGLDGEKLQISSGNNKSSGGGKSPFDLSGGDEENLEEASGNSQFDYVRRLASQIGELDQKINDSPDTHSIKAIGILGSDVYDKLLITEALHSKFPDALFFTNGMDARLLEPKNNQWARNMVIASSFGLKLEGYLQKDIPPFRDSIQTAFYLATEMALAKQFDAPNLRINKNYQTLLRTADQQKLDSLLKPNPEKPARLFEIGRTKAFDLSPNPNHTQNNPGLHPSPYQPVWERLNIALALIVSLTLSFSVPASRQFLGRSAGFGFVFMMLIVCFSLLFAINHHLWGLDGYLMVNTFIALLYITLICSIAFIDNVFLDVRDSSRRIKYRIGSAFLICIGLWAILNIVKPTGLLDEGEPYALVEGVSMWASQAIRMAALFLAGYFIIEVFRFPKLFTNWLVMRFKMEVPPGSAQDVQALDKSVSRFFYPLLSWLQKFLGSLGFSQRQTQNKDILGEWLNWQNIETRFFTAFVGSLVFYGIGYGLFRFWGAPHLPYRGERIFLLDMALVQGLIVPAYSLLLVLVSDAVMKAVKLIELYLPGNLDVLDDLGYLNDTKEKWPEATLEKYAQHFSLQPNDMREWVSMRFIVVLTRQIYGLIGYPLIIALLMVIAWSSYFDNWQIPTGLKFIIAFSIGWLLYWDYRLKKAADTARSNALKSLQARLFFSQKASQPEAIKQLEGLITMIEDYNVLVYKSFTQRPIFLNSLLILLALLGDSVDYASLASKLFKG